MKAIQNKNQTAIERAQRKRIEGERSSRHFCASPSCFDPRSPILVGDLQPVLQASVGKAKMVFFHSECWKNQ
ncbi:MAG: hypothetical protein R3F51_06715 [Cyanobacteriota/Melainabacteria group bacterium]